MKNLLTIIALLAVFTCKAVNFTWDPNPASDGPVTYRLYTSASTNGPWTLAVNNIIGTNTTYAQVPVTAAYHLTAVNSAGLESDQSNVVTFSKKPSTPGGFRAVFIDWQGTTNKNGLVIPIAKLQTEAGAGVAASITGPWGSVNRSGAADTNGVFAITGKASVRPFSAAATVTKLTFVTELTSSQEFE